MSDKYTAVETVSGVNLEWGHISREDAIRMTRAQYQHQADQAMRVLAEIDAGRVKVFHQTGVYVVRNRSEV